MANVVVSVTLSEGFPVSIFEAMACGVPLVLGKIPQLEELLTQEQNALFVPKQDSKQLAKAIIRLLKDETLRQNMIIANLDLVKKYGDFHAEMKKMEQLYKKITCD
jgi:glycosyltransferase involved in cell wall biosynthesis